MNKDLSLIISHFITLQEVTTVEASDEYYNKKAGLKYNARNAGFTPNIIISFPLLLYPTTKKNSKGGKILFPLGGDSSYFTV